MPLRTLLFGLTLSLSLLAACGDKEGDDTGTDGGGTDGGGTDGGGTDGGGTDGGGTDGGGTDGGGTDGGGTDGGGTDGGGTDGGGDGGGGDGGGGTDGGGDGGGETDADGDGWSVEAGDCDDTDPTINPDMPEIDGDMLDNDCDGFIDEGVWRFGDLVITEVMNNPQAVADPDGEWIELLNMSVDTIYLNGLTLSSTDDLDHVITSSTPLPVEPGEYVVIGSNADRLTNGGVDVLYAWTGISLSNESDRFAVSAAATLLDDVEWDDGATMPDPNGASMNLDVLYLGADLNDEPNGWCVSTSQWALGSDYGTPGAANDLCGSTDRDGDGYLVDEGDCDDTDPNIHPGAEEIWYDGIDQNCDGWSDYDADYDGFDSADYGGDDCDDTRADVNPDATEIWYDGVDQNCDGWSDYDADYDGFDSADYGGDDCDDTRADVNPGMAEICDDDNTDEDCNGLVNDDDPGVTGQTTLYLDADRDGYGTPDSSILTCESPAGYVTDNTDCDDTRADVNPGMNEICDDDNTDEDCNGLINDEDPGVVDALTYYPDEDGDGYGSDADSFFSCEALDGWVSSGGDCNDSDPDINPGATEIWYDGIDQDCDGWSDYDADRDGFDSDLYGGDDCDDDDPTVFPYAYEDMTDGVDNDCDGFADSADPDTVNTLILTDDDSDLISFASFSFPFCGDDWTDLYVGSNGRLTFDRSSTSYSESATTFVSEGYPSIAGWWDDLNPASSGTVTWIEHDDAIAVHFREVPEYGARTPNTFSYILRDDGRIILAYGEMSARDGLAGWTCGTGDAPRTVDLSAERTSIPEGSLGIGQGTEDAVFQLFTGSGTSVGDVADTVFHFCVNSGVDLDGDGWTDECGDPDDSDASVTP